MSGASRKGLKRYGMRSYLVEGPHARFVIERERPWRWLIRHINVPPGFYSEKFRRLSDARKQAEGWAGL